MGGGPTRFDAVRAPVCMFADTCACGPGLAVIAMQRLEIKAEHFEKRHGGSNGSGEGDGKQSDRIEMRECRQIAFDCSLFDKSN